MPVLSYLAHPRPDAVEELRLELETLSGCSVIPAEEGPLLVLVTETESEEEERLLRERLTSLESLAFLSLVFAHEGEPS